VCTYAYLVSEIRVKLVLAALLAAFSLLAAPAQAQSGRPDILEVIKIEGGIGDHTTRTVKDQVEKINDNQRIKAVLMIVDSPGGSAVSAAAVHEELGKIKVPVVAWCNNICASGGVYVMMATSVKYIGVRTEAIGGSVGVIVSATRYHRLLEWAKIDSETYKSGSLKDVWNPTRAPDDEEKKYIQGLVDELAQTFYGVVKAARGSKINEEAWREIKRAKIFFGKNVVKMGLADSVMTLEQAAAKAKELSESKAIYTRDELKKMSQAAEDKPGHGPYMQPSPHPIMGGLPQNVGDLIDMVKEIREGESVKFEYRMPYKF